VTSYPVLKVRRSEGSSTVEPADLPRSRKAFRDRSKPAATAARSACRRLGFA